MPAQKKSGNLLKAPHSIETSKNATKIEEYDFTIKYCPGKTVSIANCRLRIQVKNIDCNRHILNQLFNASTAQLQILKKEATRDSTLWPADRISCTPHSLARLKLQRRMLDGVKLKGNKVIIPTSPQQDVLKQLHAFHQEIKKTKLQVRTTVGRNQLGHQKHSYKMPYMPETPTKLLNRDTTPTEDLILLLAIHKYWSLL